MSHLAVGSGGEGLRAHFCWAVREVEVVSCGEHGGWGNWPASKTLTLSS